MKLLMFTLVVLGLAVPAAANTPSPYAGWQARDIKALSPQEIDDLRAGRGMSLALAAELNGYPGPRHVLDLAGELGLTDDQQRAVSRLFEAMQAEARRLGAGILEQEAALDAAFGSGGLAAAELQARLARLGDLRGKLRYTHLSTHLTMKALLSEAQVARYNLLRGYTAESPPEHGGHDQAPQPHGVH